VLEVAGCDEDDLYAAMDWLAASQQHRGHAGSAA
jgi:hypothetical protein